MTQACFSNISCVTNETFVTESAFCKKCHSKDLSKDVDGFPVCIQCGWANYDLPIPKAPTPSFIHLRASSFYVPYIGHTWKLKGLKLQVWVRDGTCTQTNMERSSTKLNVLSVKSNTGEN